MNVLTPPPVVWGIALAIKQQVAVSTHRRQPDGWCHTSQDRRSCVARCCVPMCAAVPQDVAEQLCELLADSAVPDTPDPSSSDSRGASSTRSSRYGITCHPQIPAVVLEGSGPHAVDLSTGEAVQAAGVHPCTQQSGLGLWCLLAASRMRSGHCDGRCRIRAAMAEQGEQDGCMLSCWQQAKGSA